MNSQNLTPIDCDPGAPFFLSLDDLKFLSWLRGLSPQDKQLFVDMLTDVSEMACEGYEATEIRRYLRRNYSQ